MMVDRTLHDRMVAALRMFLTAENAEGGGPAYGHYWHQGEWRCSYCESSSCNPYIPEQVMAVEHAPDCLVLVIRALVDALR